MRYWIEYKVGNEWRPMGRKGERPYSFKTRAEAEKLASRLHPHEWYDAERGGRELIRVVRHDK
jgi:hypothetical protein